MRLRAVDLSSDHQREWVERGLAGGADDASHSSRRRAGERDRDPRHLLPGADGDALRLARDRRRGIVGWHVPHAISRSHVPRVESRDDHVLSRRHAENPELSAIVRGAAALGYQSPGALDVSAARK